jgi:hypothetical protein
VLGNYNVIASGNGISNTVSFSLANTQGTTTTALTSSVNPSDFGQSVTFTATVTSVSSTPTGTVQFKIDRSNSGAPVALNASGMAQFTTSSLAAGTHTVTADYSGDSNVGGSSGTLSGDQVVRSQPQLSINDVSLTEGDSGTKIMSFALTLSAASNLAVSVNYATADGSATAPADYLATNGTLTFNPGESSKAIEVTINGDQTFEPDETLRMNLSNLVNATMRRAQGTGTILNDDAQGGILSFSVSDYNVSESTGFITITVNRTGNVSFPATVDYATADPGAPAACGTNNGKASSRCDYTTAAGTLSFAAGDSSKAFKVLISQDAYTEGSETMSLALSNPTGGAVFGVPSTATVTIRMFSCVSTTMTFSIVSPMRVGWRFGPIRSLRAAAMRSVLKSAASMFRRLLSFQLNFKKPVIWSSAFTNRLTETRLADRLSTAGAHSQCRSSASKSFCETRRRLARM